MKTVPARVGPPYHHFEPGEIIAATSTREEIEGRKDLIDKHGSYERYMFNHTWVVVGMSINDVGVIVKRVGETEPISNGEPAIDSRYYRLATAEEIAAALAKRIIGDRLPETMQVLADAMASQLHWTSEIIRHMGPSIPGAGQKIEDIKAAVEDEFKKAFCK